MQKVLIKNAGYKLLELSSKTQFFSALWSLCLCCSFQLTSHFITCIISNTLNTQSWKNGVLKAWLDIRERKWQNAQEYIMWSCINYTFHQTYGNIKIIPKFSHIDITALPVKLRGWISWGQTVHYLWSKLSQVETC